MYKFRMTIMTKLIASFLTMVLLLAIVSGAAMVTQNQNKQLANIVVQNYESLSQVQSLNYNVRSAGAYAGRFLMSQTQQEQTSLMGKFSNTTSIVNASLNQLMNKEQDSTKIQYLKKFKSSWNRYLNEYAQMVSLFHADKISQAQSVYVNKEMDPIIQPLIQYVSTQEQSNALLLKQLDAERARASMINWVITGIAAILGILIALILSLRISESLRKVRAVSLKVASGNLRVKCLEPKSNDEITDLMRATNSMVENLQTLINGISVSSDYVASTSEELSASAEETAKATNEIASSIQEVAVGAERQAVGAIESSKAIENMAKGVQHIAETSSIVANTASDAAIAAEGGYSLVKSAMQQMETIYSSVTDTSEKVKELEEHTENIGRIIDVITGIANQTNLLALNAAIEAARAGENGRGFAVVADEIGKLAEESNQSSQQIVSIIEEVKSGTEQSVESMKLAMEKVRQGLSTVQSSGQSFDDILQVTRMVAQQIQEVSATSQEMSAETQEVSASIEEIAGISEQSLANAQNVSAASEEQLASIEEIAGAANSLSESAQNLQLLINKFTL